MFCSCILFEQGSDKNNTEGLRSALARFRHRTGPSSTTTHHANPQNVSELLNNTFIYDVLSEFDIIFTEIIFKRKYICAESKHLRYIPLKSKKKKNALKVNYIQTKTRVRKQKNHKLSMIFFFLLFMPDWFFTHKIFCWWCWFSFFFYIPSELRKK